MDSEVVHKGEASKVIRREVQSCFCFCFIDSAHHPREKVLATLLSYDLKLQPFSFSS